MLGMLALGMVIGMVITLITVWKFSNKMYTEEEMVETINFYENERLRERG